MALPAANLLPTVISARFTAHPGRLGRLRIDYSCAGLWVSPQLHPQAFTQSRVELLEGSIYAPPPKPPVDGLPRREVARQKPPSAAALEDIEDGVEDLAAAVGFRSSSLVGRRNMEFQTLPFGVGEIGRVAPFHAQERTSSTYLPRFSKQFQKSSSRKLGRVDSTRFRPVASFRRSSTGRSGMFLPCGMHQRWLMVLVVTALAAVLVSSCGGGGGSQEGEDAATDTTTTTEDALNAALEQSFSESGAPGVVAAVQTPEYTWVETRGVADRTSEELMTPDVHQRIGSVNKTFTVSLLLQAAAEGLLSLDDTIDQYVEGVPNGDEITLRQMADMTSGIASYTFNEQFQEDLVSDPQRIWTPEELVQIGIEDSPAFDPGTEF